MSLSRLCVPVPVSVCCLSGLLSSLPSLSFSTERQTVRTGERVRRGERREKRAERRNQRARREEEGEGIEVEEHERAM
eukprot:3334988-Rhodomonas_salina.1